MDHPLFIALALAVGLAFASAPALAALQRERSQAQMELRLQELPPEMRESPPEEFTDVPEPSPVRTLWGPLVSAAAGILLGWLLRAALLHLTSMALGGRQSFGAVYRASVWASFPLLLRSSVQLVYTLVGGGMIAGAGLSGLVAASPATDSVAQTAPSILSILLSRCRFLHDLVRDPAGRGGGSRRQAVQGQGCGRRRRVCRAFAADRLDSVGDAGVDGWIRITSR